MPLFEVYTKIITVCSRSQLSFCGEFCYLGIRSWCPLLPKAIDHLGSFPILRPDLFKSDMAHYSNKKRRVEVPGVLDTRSWQNQEHMSEIFELPMYQTQHFPCNHVTTFLTFSISLTKVWKLLRQTSILRFWNEIQN